jgi:RNA polymerase sigma-B factor
MLGGREKRNFVIAASLPMSSSPALRSGAPVADVHGRAHTRAHRRGLDRALVARAQEERTPAARAAAVEAFMPLVHSVARRYHRGEEPLDDLQQVASVGLLKAIDGFDPTRGTAFVSYAVPTIVGELRRHFRDKGWMIRVSRDLQEISLKMNGLREQMTSEIGRSPTLKELAARSEVSVERLLEAREASHAMRPGSLDRPTQLDGDSEGDALADRFGTVEAGYGHAEDAITVDRLIRRLPEIERHVVSLRFGEDLTQQEVADRMGISKTHVSRVLRRALAGLRAMADDDRRSSERRIAGYRFADREPRSREAPGA